MPKKRKVETGDIICVSLDDGVLVAGIVLHVSKVFKGGVIVGFYNQVFKSTNDINIDQLEGEFVDTPNYVIKEVITKGKWSFLGNRVQLLARVSIPELRVAYHVYYKDEVVRTITVNEFKDYAELGMAGGRFLENKLKRHFLKTPFDKQ